MDDQAGGNTGAVGVSTRRVQAHVVHLRPQSKVREQPNINASANAIRELIGGTQAGPHGDARPPKQRLRKRGDVRGIPQRQPWTEQIRVGVQ